MRSERQLGFLWGAVAVLLMAASPLAERIAATLPACPVKVLSGVPCPSCGTTRAAIALSRLDLAAAVATNPLAALLWITLVLGGLVAGFAALSDHVPDEPFWHVSTPIRWLMLLALTANWAYLVGIDA